MSARTRDLRSKAEWRGRLATTGFVVGGASLVAGIAIFLLNEPRNPNDQRSALVPTATPSGLVWGF